MLSENVHNIKEAEPEGLLTVTSKGLAKHCFAVLTLNIRRVTITTKGGNTYGTIKYEN